MFKVLAILAIVYGVLVLETISIDGRAVMPSQVAVPTCLILFGGIVLFIAFLGCCGAIRENSCMMMCYSVIMLMLLILKVILIVGVWVNKDKISDGLGNIIQEAWDSSKNDPDLFASIEKSVCF